MAVALGSVLQSPRDWQSQTGRSPRPGVRELRLRLAPRQSGASSRASHPAAEPVSPRRGAVIVSVSKAAAGAQCRS